MTLSYGTGGEISVSLEGPFGSVGSGVRMAQITLPAAGWKEAVSPFSQEVTLEGLSQRSKVDLLPSFQQLEDLRNQELALTTENCDGILTVYAIGDKPQSDLIFQAAIMEVSA